jgi:hypothetical protein
MNTQIENAISQELALMTPSQQQHLLQYARKLASHEPRPIEFVHGKKLLKYVGLFPKDDLEEIKTAIEKDCRQVDLDEW